MGAIQLCSFSDKHSAMAMWWWWWW